MTHAGTPWDVFLAFSRASLLGFGGMLPQVYRLIVERLEWLSPDEFAQLWTVALILPGPAICNLAVMVGHRRAGFAGGLMALLGAVLLPAIFVVALGAAYARFQDIERVRQALHGMSAAAAGLFVAMAFKMKAGGTHRWLPWLFVAVVFVAIGVLRLPFLLVAGVTVPAFITFSWRRPG